MSLLEKLNQYCSTDAYPFHMPGHKRKFHTDSVLPYSVDITEITGFDNYHAPEKGGVLDHIYEKAKKLYKSEASFPLVNGSTSGIMAAISSVCDLKEEIIIARNCHRSVYCTCELLGLKTHYICPDYREDYGIFTDVNIERLEENLKNYPDSKAVVITSPTYEGVILDIHKIAQVVHRYNMVLIVDEAHGAHLPFAMPDKSALYAGADIVIQSLHKTLPSLTQTAILHVSKEAVAEGRVTVQNVAQYVSLYQSTSPSYILMASMEECLDACIAWQKENAFLKYYGFLEKERENYEQLNHFSLLDATQLHTYAYDNSRFVIATKEEGMSAQELFSVLRDEYHIECEMQAAKYVVAISTICDSKEGFLRLRNAMYDIDKKLDEKNRNRSNNSDRKEEETKQFAIPESVMTIREAVKRAATEVSLEQLKARLEQEECAEQNGMKKSEHCAVCAEYVMPYPPGIPVIAPGEKYNMEVVAIIEDALKRNLQVLGVHEGKVKVVE